eukprot:3656173-Prorocentrum_lima.AAC.1
MGVEPEEAEGTKKKGPLQRKVTVLQNRLEGTEMAVEACLEVVGKQTAKYARAELRITPNGARSWHEFSQHVGQLRPFLSNMPEVR